MTALQARVLADFPAVPRAVKHRYVVAILRAARIVHLEAVHTWMVRAWGVRVQEGCEYG